MSVEDRLADRVLGELEAQRREVAGLTQTA